MARADTFDGLSEFLAIARRGSFRGAALDLGVTPSAVSQALQGLERRLGLPLFHRTTRKVALTEAGERLLAQLAPAAETITATLDELVRLQARPPARSGCWCSGVPWRMSSSRCCPAFAQPGRNAGGGHG